MAQRTAITPVLTTCGFTAQRTYIMTNEGLDRWTNFTMVDFDNLTNIAKQASCYTAPFTVGILKLKCLKALKFWIEDKIRMNERPVANHFTQDVLTNYIRLYAAFVAAIGDNVEFVVGLQLDANESQSLQVNQGLDI